MSIAIERKLTTILAADAEGYSRLMESDEVAAMTTLMDCRDVFKRLIDRHRGRIANTAGDGLIAEFPSVVEAVQCAVEVQRELAARNRQRANTDPMQFRIGIHLGDVMVDRGDLFGEGVNLAARLQTMAEPGGVMISRAVYDQVRAKLAIDYEYLGERQARNLAEKVAAYRVLLNGTPAADGGPSRSNRESATDTVPSPSGPGGVEADPPNSAEVTSKEAMRGRVARHAKQLGIVWAALLAIDLFTGGDDLWAIWPGIVMATILGLEAAPLIARSWIGVTTVRLAVIILALAMINAATGSDRPWFLWPAGALIVVWGLTRSAPIRLRR